jgi:hypothetical protein
MDNLVKRIETLEEFFGCEFLKVNKTIRLILIYGCKGDTPEWLRGKNKYTDLPRLMNTTLPHSQQLNFRDREIAVRVKWIIENLSHGWRLSQRGVEFEDENDLMYYILAFGLD